MPFPDRTDRPSVQPCGCFAEECPEPVNIGYLNPDGTSVPYWVCNHSCPADHHGSRHYVTKNLIAKPTNPHDIALLHVYSPGAWHGDLLVVGNLDGLTALRNAVVHAIEDAKLRMGIEEREDVVVRTTDDAMTSDGEGFPIRVLLDNRPWYSKPEGRFVWDYRLPYIDDDAKGRDRESGRDPEGEWYLCETCGKTYNEHEQHEAVPPGHHEWKPRLSGDPAPKEA